ncbi:MAG: hypothetical protein CVU46_14400 [Chloroflexi bacterium HGW-Chloroflexi-8]|nr:MAG: hypothetical protein CVU46_14400 [Chloroflexi bacterium HGW-Chloroflexi-8]
MLILKLFRFLANTFLIICLFGCTTSNISVNETDLPKTQNMLQPTITASVLPTATSTNQPTPTNELGLLQNDNLNSFISYQIRINYDYSKQSASVSQSIKYKNILENPILEVLLACDPLRIDNVFRITSTLVNGISKEVEIGEYWLKIPLESPLEKDQEITIELDYELLLPQIPAPAGDQKPVIFGYTTLQSNFVDWYPMIVPRGEDGQWILHKPWFYGEYLVYPLANYEIDLTISNAPVNLIVAASDLPIESTNLSFVFNTSQTRNFVWSVSPSYQFSQAEVEGITVTSYYFPFHKNAGEQVLTDTINAIKLYSDLFTNYRGKNLTVVEADFLDGMEFDGFYFLSKGFYNLFDGTPKGYLTTIAVHETAHQWWYSQIANDQALEPWLDEALCTYSEYLYYEFTYPELKDWWWSYRVDFYKPEGKINASIYDYRGFLPYRDATYLRGAKFLQQLRDQMGDEKFFSFLKSYSQINQNKISTSKSFWDVLSKSTNDPFTDLKSEYFN